MDTRGTVVVVHPSPERRADVCASLDRAGFAAVVAQDALNAATLVGHDENAVVLVAPDPRASHRFGFVRELRGQRAAAHVPVIALLESAREEDVHAAMQAGVDDLLFEPMRPVELGARILGRLKTRASAAELDAEKHDVRVMLELTQALASSLDFREILFTVVRRMAEVLGVPRVSIVLAPEPSQGDVGFVIVASDDERIENLRVDLAKYPEIQEVLRSREPLTIADASSHPLLEALRASEQPPFGTATSLFPIVFEDQAFGVVFLRAPSGRGTLKDRESRFCQLVANATAVALRNARVMQSLRDHTQQVTFARFEAERRLRSLKRYADLFANVAEGIAACDATGKLLFANPRAFEIVGRTERDLEGQKLMDVVHPQDRHQVRALWTGFKRGEYPRGIDVRLVRDSGEVVVTSCSFASMVDGGSILLISFQDVTEQRRTEAELVKTMEFLESLVDASVDGIIAADIRGTIILFNPSAERIYGFRAEDVIGRLNAKSLYPGDGAREVMRMLRSEDYGGVGRLSPTRIDALDVNEQVIPIQISAAIIYERGEPAATFGIFTDLREKLHVEKRLEAAQRKLAVTEKQALIAELAGTAAHELNQPLTGILACAELLRRRGPASPNEARALELLVRESERMADIVKRIGNITSYETKNYVGDQRILDLALASKANPKGGDET